MTEPETAAPWWEATPDGTVLDLGLVRIDLVGSPDWDALPLEALNAALARSARYGEPVEWLARRHGASQPLDWKGDAVLLLVRGEDGFDAARRAFALADALWQKFAIELDMGTRIAAHVARVPWQREHASLRHDAIEICRRLEAVAPERAVVVTEDLFLALRPPAGVADRRDEFGPLGFARAAETPAYVRPARAAARRDPSAFADEAGGSFVRRLIDHAEGEQAWLRYVGFKLPKKAPPVIHVDEVFVEPELELQDRGALELPGPVARELADADDEEGEFAGPKRRRAAHPWDRGDVRASILLTLSEALRRTRTLVVVGDPGSGKTTLLRWLAWHAAAGRVGLAGRTGIDERCLPLLVSVGRLAEVRDALPEGSSVLDALARYFAGLVGADEPALRAFLESRLNSGACLVLLDGLDETAAERRPAITDWLRTFVLQHPGCRFVVTSRIVGFEGFDAPGAETVRLGAFGPEQVSRYVRCFTAAYARWEGSDAALAERAATELLAAIEANPRLAALARNPFLLSALALIHRAEGRLPQHRVLVYDRFAEALCETWADVRRTVKGEKGPSVRYAEEAIPVFGHLALRMHEEHPAGIAPRRFVLDEIRRALAEFREVPDAEGLDAAEAWLRKARDETQILVERGPDEWAFLHLTFQEFFAAVHLVATTGRYEEYLDEHLYETRWQEVLRLGIGYMALVQRRRADVRRTLERLVPFPSDRTDDWLAGRFGLHWPVVAGLVDEAVELVPRELLETVVSGLLWWCKSLQGDLRELERFAHTALKPHLVGPLMETLRSSRYSDYERAAAARALGFLRATDATETLLDVVAARSADGSLEREASEALLMIRDPAAVARMRDVLESRATDYSVPRRLACALVALGDEETIARCIANLRERTRHPFVRIYSADALGWGPVRAESQSALIAMFRDKGEEHFVRGAGAASLARLGRPEHVGPLGEVFRDASELVAVRCWAGFALSEMRSAEATDSLRAALLNRDEHASLRACAADALGGMPRGEFIRDLVRVLEDSGDADEVRAAACWSLGHHRIQRVAPWLIEFVRESKAQSPLRDTAILTLGALRTPQALDVLSPIVRDTSAPMSERADAARSLGEIGNPDAVPDLLALAAGPSVDGEIVVSVANAIRSLARRVPRAVLLAAARVGPGSQTA